MKNKTKKLFTLLKRPRIFIPGLIILIGLLVTTFYFKNSDSKKGIVIVKKGDITQRVDISGKTKPVSSVELGFDSSGRVKIVSVDVGGYVKVGQVLAELDNSELNASLLQARANYDAENAKFSELKRGTRPEELQIAKTAVTNAEVSFENAQNSLIDKLKDSYTKLDDAIKNHADRFYTFDFGTPSFGIFFRDIDNNYSFGNDSYWKYSLQEKREEMTKVLSAWEKSINSLTDNSDLKVYTKEANNNLYKGQSLLNLLATAVNGFTTSDFTYQATLDGYRTTVQTARTNINSAISSLALAEQSYNSAKASLDSAKENLSLKEAGNTPETISTQDYKVAQALAQVKSVEAQISKNKIVSPIDGTVTKQDAKVGEVASVSSPVISVMSDQNLEIEAFVPEINVSKVSIGNIVKITFDAIPKEEFLGKIAYVDPAETILGGVPNYKVKVSLDKADQRLKSGLTANLSVETSFKANVLVIPRYTISEDFSVNRLNSRGKAEKVVISTGLDGDDGLIEVISGLKEGDSVVYTK